MVDHIHTLLAAGSALLTAEERLLAFFPEQADRAHGLARDVLAAARGAIFAALGAPGDARQRLGLLQAAVEADGIASPLVAQAAAALAEAALEDATRVEA